MEPTNGFSYFPSAMKKALLLALAGLLSALAPAAAYPPAANVNFSSERGVPFGLVLDGRAVTRGAARQVHVDRLVPGAHWADFTVPTAYGGAVRFRSRVWLEPGVETSFVLVARPGRPLDLRQVAAVALYGPRGYGNGYNNNGYNNGYNNGGQYNSPAPYPQGGYSNGGNSSGNGGYYNAPNGGNNNNNYPSNGGNGYPNGNSGGSYPGNGYPNNNGNGGYYPGSATSSYRALQPQEVSSLVQAVKQRPFESSKLSVAKEALAQSSMQSDDLKRLLRSFDFESSRVELAKFAYAHVSDPENFYRVYEAFDFDASTQEVQQAIGSVPN